MAAGAALIVIVDDQASVRRALIRLFRLADYRTQAFETAIELLDSLPSADPSCVVLDLHLPGMSGVELLRQLRTLPAPPPVIVITADDRPELLDECLALGSRSCFRKPLDCEALLNAVDEIVAVHH